MQVYQLLMVDNLAYHYQKSFVIYFHDMVIVDVQVVVLFLGQSTSKKFPRKSTGSVALNRGESPNDWFAGGGGVGT
eukprot:UN05287